MAPGRLCGSCDRCGGAGDARRTALRRDRSRRYEVRVSRGFRPRGHPGRTRFPTTTPEATLRNALEFLRSEQVRQGPLSAVGIASFGPVDLHPGSATFGFITSTPKPGWANVDVAGAARVALAVPVGFDTDVNAAALAEWRWGGAQGLDTVHLPHGRYRASAAAA